MAFPITRIKDKTPVIIYPGLITHTDSSFFNFCEDVRKSFGRDTIDVFVDTWDEEFARSYNAAFKIECSNFSCINLHFYSEPFNSNRFIEFLDRIEKGNLGSYEFVKRFIIFYKINSVLQKVRNKISNPYIFKVRSAQEYMGTRGDNREFVDIIQHISVAYNELQFYVDFLDYESIVPENIFWTEKVNHKGLSEVFFNSSLDTLQDIFGKTPEELSNKMRVILNSWKERFPGITTNNLIHSKKFPPSGPLLLRQLASLWDVNFISGVNEMYLNLFRNIKILDKEKYKIGYYNPYIKFDEDWNTVYETPPRIYFPKNAKGLLIQKES